MPAETPREDERRITRTRVIAATTGGDDAAAAAAATKRRVGQERTGEVQLRYLSVLLLLLLQLQGETKHTPDDADVSPTVNGLSTGASQYFPTYRGPSTLMEELQSQNNRTLLSYQPDKSIIHLPSW